ncbi:hypothetical protein [Weissella sp. MSCH1]|uniref:hypothetical protein n=1 Tax=Weissella sp. MSCH1 TaxID=3383343 RepID=UPI003896D2E5
MLIAKKTGLSWDEMQMMDLGQVMDFIVEYANSEMKSQERAKSDKKPARKAQQQDFDAF